MRSDALSKLHRYRATETNALYVQRDRRIFSQVSERVAESFARGFLRARRNPHAGGRADPPDPVKVSRMHRGGFRLSNGGGLMVDATCSRIRMGDDAATPDRAQLDLCRPRPVRGLLGAGGRRAVGAATPGRADRRTLARAEACRSGHAGHTRVAGVDVWLVP